jgi:protein-tyrosine-phosphatase
MGVIAKKGILGGRYVHHARQVCEEDFERFDYIMGMDRDNVRNLNFVKRRLEHRREAWVRDQETEKKQKEGQTGSTLRQLRRRASALSQNAEFSEEASAGASAADHLHPESATAVFDDDEAPEPEMEAITPYMGPLAEVHLFGEYGAEPVKSKSKLKFRRGAPVRVPSMNLVGLFSANMPYRQESNRAKKWMILITAKMIVALSLHTINCRDLVKHFWSTWNK